MDLEYAIRDCKCIALFGIQEVNGYLNLSHWKIQKKLESEIEKLQSKRKGLQLTIYLFRMVS